MKRISQFPGAAVATGALVVIALAANAGGLHLPRKEGADLPPDAGRDSLRQEVQNQCLDNWLKHHDAAPCESVSVADAGPESRGFAVLADRTGGAHYLLVPTQTMAGTDSEELLDPDLPNYFAQAWRSRNLLSKFVGHPVPRTAVALAVNSLQARTQNQFHIHIECLRQDVRDALHAGSGAITENWAPLPLAGSTYQAMRIVDPNLDGSNPFELLAKLNPDAKHHLGSYTLLVAGMQFKDGAGFVLLTSNGPSAGLLLDSTCETAGGGG